MQVLSTQSWPRQRQHLILLLSYLNHHIVEMRREYIWNDEKKCVKFAIDLLSERLGKKYSAVCVRKEAGREYRSVEVQRLAKARP